MNNKFLQTLLLSIVSSLSLHAQLSGNISIPGNYPSLQAAIVALNTQGVGGVGVTFDISAGHVEFLTQKIVITTTGTVSRPIVIRKNGIGANPVFFSYSGTSAGIGATSDGFIVIDGGDYITIDGLHFEESAINNDATKAMEYGILLCKKSTSDGAKFNTIQNCTFNLKNYNQTAAALGESWYRGSVGIAMVNSLATFNASLNVTAASGSNSFNHFYNNEISGAHCGISIIGFAPASGFSSLPLVNTFFGDIANHIGTSNTTGNLIRNFGGNSSESSAIYASQQWGLDIKYNTIENNDGNFVDHLGTMHGIYCRDAQGASVTISHNNITLTSSSNINPLTSIRNTFGSNPTDANIVAIDSNVLVNSSALNAISGFVYRGIWSNASPNTLKIWDNEISGFLYNTSNNTAIQSIVEIGSTPSYVSMQNNIISDIEIPTTGTFNAVVFQANNNIDSIDFINNTIANLIKTPNTNGALMHMYYNPSASLGGKQNIIQNNIQNIENGNGGFYGFRLNSNIQQTSILKNNTLLNVTSNALSDVSYGVFLDAAASGSEISENTITNFNSKASIYGIYTDTNVDSILMRRNVLTNIYSDVVNNNSNVAGIRVSGLKSLLEGNNISEIYNMGLNSNALVSGILVDGLSQGYLINNQVVQIKNLSGNLANAIAGIRVNAANSLSILHNTIYPSGGSSLNSSGTLFGGAALYLPSTTQANVSNNIFNISGVSKSTGFFASIGLTSTGTNGTAPSNLTLSHNILYSNDYLYAEGISTSNATNLFYSTSNSVFGKSAIGNDDAGFNSNCSSSFIDFFNGSALQNFIENNLVNSASGFSPSGLSFAESSAKKDISPIVNKDIAQNSRGLNADRGALEFSGTALDFGLPQIQITPKDNIVCLNALTIHAKITDNVSVNTSTAKPRLYYKRESDLNQIPVTNTKANDGWKYIEASGIAPNFVFLLDTSKFSAHLNAGEKIQYFVMAQDNNSSPNVSSSASFASNFCPSSVVLTNSAMPVSAFNEFIYLGNPNSEFTATQNPACQNSLDTISVINFVLDSSNRIGTQNLVSSVVSPVISSVSFGRKSQFIITSNELKAAGLVSGALTGITLPFSSTTSSVLINDFSITIGNTNLAQLPSDFISGTNSVNVRPTSVFFLEPGENSISFTNNFFWDGVSNIVLEFCHGPLVSNDPIEIVYSSGLPNGIGLIKDSSTACNALTGSRVSLRPNFRFFGNCNYTDSIVTFLWSQNSSNIGTNNDSLIVNVDLMGGLFARYILNYTDKFGCSFIDSTQIDQQTSNLSVNAAFLDNNTPCFLDSLQISLDFSGGCRPYNVSYKLAKTFGGNKTPLSLSPTNKFRASQAKGYVYVDISDFAGNTLNNYFIDSFILPDTFIAVHDTTCGHGSVTLGYVGTPLLQANWYKEKNSFTSVNSGNTFTIANLTQTDTFYVSNVASISNGSFGLSNPFIGDTFSANSGSIAMEFHISKPLILQSIDIYPYEPVGTNAAIGIYDDQNNLLSRVNYVTNVSNGIGLPISAQTIFINLGLIQGTYYLKQIDSINLLGTSNGFTLPLVNPFGVISTNSLANNSNYFFYNYQYEYVCEGPRTEVYAVVVPPPIIELDKSSIQICDANTNTTTELVKLTKTDPVYNQFSWSSNNRGSATGSSTSGWFLTTVGMGPDIFTLTASSTRLNCINYASIAVHPVPYNASRDIEVAQAHHCLSGSTKLTLVGGPVIGASYQWEQSDDLSNWTNIDGATGIQYSTPVITDTTYYRVRLYCQGTEILPNISPVNPDTVFVHNPSILSVTHDTVCGMRGALLEAVSTTGKVAWFDKNNFPISSSPTLFMSVTENDTFYASAKTDPLIPSNLIASKNPIFWNTNHTGQGVMFSLTPLNDIIVDSIYVRTDEPSPLQYVYIYKKSGTYKGFETNSSSWTSIDTVLASLVTSFRGNYLAIPIKSNLLSLNLNEQISLFLDFNAASSSTISPGIQDQYLNSDLMIQSGSAVSTNFTSFTADRGFTGQIIYRKPCISPKIPVYITYINPPDFILNLEKDTVCINEISDTLRIVSPIGNYDSYFVSGFPSNYTSFGDLVADGYTVIKPNELMAHSLSIVAEQSSGDQCLMTNSFELIVNDTPSSIVFAHAKTIDLCYDSVYRISAMSGTRLTEEIGVGFTPLDDLTSPFYNSPSSSLNQRLHYLVLASELTAAGFQKGNLNSLALKVVAQNSGIYSNFSIGLAHTSISDLTTNFSTFTGNQVFNTLNYTPILGWNNFVFNSPFVWDGVSNILVEMCYLSNPGLSSSVESVSIPAIPNPTNHSTNGNCTSATTGTLTTMRPKFRFVQDNTFPIYWTPATGLYSDAAMTIPYNSNNHSEVIYASPLDTISYLVYSENESKCRNFDTFTINVIPPVQISKNLPKLIEACEKTPVSFSFYALNHTQIQWYYGKTKATMAPLGPLAAKSDSVKNFPIISLNDSGFYVAELISANNCHRFFTDTIQVKVYPEIILQGTSPNTTICEGNQIDVFAHADNYQSLTWHRYNSLVTETLSNSSETYEKPLANLSDSGFYYVTYKAFSFCEDKVSDTFYISVLPNININSVPVNDTVCVGNSRTFTYDAVGVTQYKWFRNNILLTNNSNNLNLSSITLNDSGLYRVELIGGAGCPSSIQEFRLTVRGNVAKLNSISDAQICESSDFTLSAGSIALFDSSYRWYYAPTASGPYMLLANQNKRDLNFPSFQSSDAGFYYYESLAYSPCASSPLDTFELDFIPRPSFTSIPSDQSVCANDSIILTVSADNVASYKWIKDGNELIGRNTDTLIIKGFPANVGTYRVIAMSGNTCLNDTSLNFNIKVDQPIQITKNLPKFDSTCLGNELNLSVVPSGYNQYNFKWYKNNITISTDSVYTIPKATLDENASYFVIVSVNATACPTVISDTVKYTVNLPINQISDLIDTTICLGSNFTYAIEAEHVKAYKWYRNGSLVSAPLAQYVINNANISNQGTYHVVLEGLKGCNNLTSSNSKLLVDSNSGFSINLPKIDSICINNNYKLAVVPVNLNGSKFQFSWHYNNSFLTNDSVFTINTAQLNQTGQYYVKVKSLSGVCGEFISDTLRLVVNPEVRKPIITGPNLACELSTNTLLASNVINHSGVNWFKVGGVTPIHYSNPLDNKYTAQWTENYTGQYIAVGLGLKGCSNVTSDTFAVKVQKAVKIVNQPLSRVYNVGDSLILYSKAENAKQSFWIKDGVILPGKDKDSLIIYPMSLTDTGNYQRYFIGESPCNDTLKSRIALVTTDRCPRIVSPPVSTINICEGQEFSLNIYALGVQRYQWFLNGIPLPLGIQENYSIRSAESNDEGIYHVELYGRPGFGCSMVMSNKTLVTVVKKPQIYKSLEPPKYCNPIGHEFKIDANFSAGFSWYLNGLRIKDSINNTFTITNTNSISPNGDVFQVEVVGNSPCTSVFSDTIRVLNRDPAIRVALASETALNLAPQCEDIDGFTYYAQRNSPNVFLFAINHKGNQVDFSPDLYVNSGETIINYSAYNFNYGYIFGKRLFNVDVVRGDLTSSYDIRFFYEPQNFDNVLRSFNSMKNLFEAQGKIVRNLFDINAWFLSTQIPFTSALLRNFSQPINFTYMYALNPDRGTKGNIPYVDIKGLFADNGGGTNIVKFQVNSRSSQITDIEDMDISIYPNPSNTGLFTVNMMSPILKSFNFQVYDMTGRKVYEQTQDKHSFETSFNLNLENLSNGNYQLVISNEDYQQAYKLTILK